MSKSGGWLSKVIAAIELIGAAATAFFLVFLIVESVQNIEALPVVLFLFAPISLFFIILGFAAGLLLWKNEKLGYKLSVLLQALQIVNVSSVAFSYLYVAGPYLMISYLEGAGVSLSAGIASNLQIYINEAGRIAGLGVNLIALVFTLYLAKAIKYSR